MIERSMNDGIEARIYRAIVAVRERNLEPAALIMTREGYAQLKLELRAWSAFPVELGAIKEYRGLPIYFDGEQADPVRAVYQ